MHTKAVSRIQGAPVCGFFVFATPVRRLLEQRNATRSWVGGWQGKCGVNFLSVVATAGHRAAESWLQALSKPNCYPYTEPNRKDSTGPLRWVTGPPCNAALLMDFTHRFQARNLGRVKPPWRSQQGIVEPQRVAKTPPPPPGRSTRVSALLRVPIYSPCFVVLAAPAGCRTVSMLPTLRQSAGLPRAGKGKEATPIGRQPKRGWAW